MLGRLRDRVDKGLCILQSSANIVCNIIAYIDKLGRSKSIEKCAFEQAKTSLKEQSMMIEHHIYRANMLLRSCDFTARLVGDWIHGFNALC